MASIPDVPLGGYKRKQKAKILSGLRALGAPAETWFLNIWQALGMGNDVTGVGHQLSLKLKRA